MKKHDDESGDWQGLDAEVQHPRYAAIAAILGNLRPEAKILDVGCGEALLSGWLPTGIGYSGVEPSSVAVRKALLRKPDLKISQVTAEAFDDPSHPYDCVVFNEMLYYADDPIGLVKKYSNFLSSEGSVLCSIFQKPDFLSVKQCIRTMITFRRPRSAIRCDRRLHAFMNQGKWDISEDRMVGVPGTGLNWHIWLAKPPSSQA